FAAALVAGEAIAAIIASNMGRATAAPMPRRTILRERYLPVMIIVFLKPLLRHREPFGTVSCLRFPLLNLRNGNHRARSCWQCRLSSCDRNARGRGPRHK